MTEPEKMAIEKIHSDLKKRKQSNALPLVKISSISASILVEEGITAKRAVYLAEKFTFHVFNEYVFIHYIYSHTFIMLSYVDSTFHWTKRLLKVWSSSSSSTSMTAFECAKAVQFAMWSCIYSVK